VNPKDRGLIARIAGNIAGPMHVHIEETGVGWDGRASMADTVAKKSVEIAIAIIRDVDRRIAYAETEAKEL
jgi:hypothetical protein